LLAGVGVGVWPSVDAACAETITVAERVSPNPEATEKYESMYEQYRKLYPALKSIFAALAQ
jgi:xylulokinase